MVILMQKFKISDEDLKSLHKLQKSIGELHMKADQSVYKLKGIPYFKRVPLGNRGVHETWPAQHNFPNQQHPQGHGDTRNLRGLLYVQRGQRLDWKSQQSAQLGGQGLQPFEKKPGYPRTHHHWVLLPESNRHIHGLVLESLGPGLQVLRLV